MLWMLLFDLSPGLDVVRTRFHEYQESVHLISICYERLVAFIDVPWTDQRSEQRERTQDRKNNKRRRHTALGGCKLYLHLANFGRHRHFSTSKPFNVSPRRYKWRRSIGHFDLNNGLLRRSEASIDLSLWLEPYLASPKQRIGSSINLAEAITCCNKPKLWRDYKWQLCNLLISNNQSDH